MNTKDYLMSKQLFDYCPVMGYSFRGLSDSNTISLSSYDSFLFGVLDIVESSTVNTTNYSLHKLHNLFISTLSEYDDMERVEYFDSLYEIYLSSRLQIIDIFLSSYAVKQSLYSRLCKILKL